MGCGPSKQEDTANKKDEQKSRDAPPAEEEQKPQEEEKKEEKKEEEPQPEEKKPEEEEEKKEEEKQEEEAAADAPPAAAAATAITPEEQAKRKAMWEDLRAKLPRSRSAEDRKARRKLFKAFDPNGNGFLSLAEIDAGCRHELALHEVTDNLAPILQRSYEAARKVHETKGAKAELRDGFVERCEFRILMVQIFTYFELYFMFAEIDTSDDRRVNFEEFQKAEPQLKEWGAKFDDAQAEFDAIDSNDGGVVLFAEFAKWAAAKSLDAEGDEEETDKDEEEEEAAQS